jgi:hypothetical protein
VASARTLRPRAAEQLGAHGGVLSQVGGGGRIADAQAGQQRLHRVGRPNGVGAIEVEDVGVERLDLRVQRQRRDRLEHFAHRQAGRIGTEGRDRERAAAAAEEHRGDQRGQLARMFLQQSCGDGQSPVGRDGQSVSCQTSDPLG